MLQVAVVIPDIMLIHLRMCIHKTACKLTYDQAFFFNSRGKEKFTITSQVICLCPGLFSDCCKTRVSYDCIFSDWLHDWIYLTFGVISNTKPGSAETDIVSCIQRIFGQRPWCLVAMYLCLFKILLAQWMHPEDHQLKRSIFSHYLDTIWEERHPLPIDSKRFKNKCSWTSYEEFPEVHLL